jgi:hypothetical protein
MSKSFLPVLAILVIAALEVAAMAHGLNGTILSLTIGSIAGITGYHIKSKRKNFY